MPAVSKAQKKLFQLALAVKQGLVDKNKVDDKIKDLSKKPEKDLKDYAETPDKKLPSKLEENSPMATPASVNGMGDVSLPGNPTTQDAFSTQETGSGDLAATSALTDGSKKENKKAKDMYKFLKYNAFVGENVNESIDEGVSNFDDAYWQIDKWLNLDYGDPDETDKLYDEWNELVQKGKAKDIQEFIEAYADEDQLYRYGITSRDMKKFAKYIADSQRS